MRFRGVIGVGALLALAMSLLTTLLTGRTEVRSVPFLHEPVEDYALELQRELDRLYLRYEDRLSALIGRMATSPQNSFATERMASRIVGVRSLTRLPLTESGEGMHIEVRETGEGERPYTQGQFSRPVLSGSNPDMASGVGAVRPVDPAQFSGRTGSSGWLPGEGSELFRWALPRPEYVVLVGVDQQSVASITSGWLTENESLSDGLSTLLELTGAAAIRLKGPDRTVVSTAGKVPEVRGERVQFPASIRFGTWTVEGTGKSSEVRVRDLPLFIAGQALAVCLLLGAAVAGVSLRRANRMARQRVSFVNRTSHELRTPITNMMLNVDLAREMVGEDPGAARARLDRVSGEASRLSRLVDNLLTFSRSENGTDLLRPEELDPQTVLSEVLEQFEMSLQDREIEVLREGKGGGRVLADPDALAQVFGNLLSNVEKYAASGKRLEIVTSQSEGSWFAEFRDHGPGIPVRQAERIFEPFHRARDEVSEGVSGTGLGLAIARDLARRMGGELRLLSSEEGATFRLEIPIAGA